MSCIRIGKRDLPTEVLLLEVVNRGRGDPDPIILDDIELVLIEVCLDDSVSLYGHFEINAAMKNVRCSKMM